MKRFSAFFVIVFVIFFCFDAVAEEVTCTHSNRKYIYLEAYEERLNPGGKFYCYKLIQPIELVCLDCNSELGVEYISRNYEHEFAGGVCKKCGCSDAKVWVLNILFSVSTIIGTLIMIAVFGGAIFGIGLMISIIIKVARYISAEHKKK